MNRYQPDPKRQLAMKYIEHIASLVIIIEDGLDRHDSFTGCDWRTLVVHDLQHRATVPLYAPIKASLTTIINLLNQKKDNEAIAEIRRTEKVVRRWIT